MGFDSCLFIQIRGLTNYIFGDFTINLYRAVQLIHFILLIPILFWNDRNNKIATSFES